KLQQQILSGQQITQASDNPAKAQQLLGLQTEGASFQQYYDNTSHALDINQSTYTAVNSLNDIASRATSIALQGNSITSSESFDSYGVEVSGLIEQAISAANQQFNGSDAGRRIRMSRLSWPIGTAAARSPPSRMSAPRLALRFRWGPTRASRPTRMARPMDLLPPSSIN
ncbi:MAG: hypothetical protein QM796_18210, partial [Chthoniobacteraceae bacterium]